MNTTDNLLQIIRLLTPSEKKYFKQYIATRKDSKFYAALFDLLLKQEEYDPALLALRLKKTGKQISDAKAYLTQVLMRSLESYSRDSTPHMTVISLLNQAEIIRRKGLPLLALDILTRAEVIADKYDYFLSLIQIEKLRQSIHTILYQMPAALQAGQRIDHYMALEQNLADYRNLDKQMAYLTFPRREEGVGLTPAQMRDHPLLQHPSTALSLTAKTFYYRIGIAYHIWYGDKKVSNQLARDLHALIRDHAEKLDGNNLVKGGTLLIAAKGLQEPVPGTPEFYAVLDDLDTVAASIRQYDRNYYLDLQGGAGLYRISTHVYLRHFAEGVRYFQAFRADDDTWSGLSPVVRALMLFEAALRFYFEGQRDRAIQLIQEIDELKVRVLSSGRTFVRVRALLAMIAFDEGNVTTMDSQMLAAKRHAKENKISMLELNHMHRTMTRLLSARVTKAEYAQMIEKSRDLIQSVTKYSVLQIFHFDHWLEHRAGRP